MQRFFASVGLLVLLSSAFELAEAAKAKGRSTPKPEEMRPLQARKTELADAVGLKSDNKGFKKPKAAAENVIPAKARNFNLARASVGLGQGSLALPPPSANWLVIMQRFDFSVDFYRNWTEYKNGFGDFGLDKEFWLGNELVHLLTTRVPHKLRIEMLTNDSLFYADYDSFSIDSEAKKYKLHVSGYSGNAGDSMTAKAVAASWYHDGLGFSTPDADNDNATYSCSNYFKAAWWFNDCYYACLTCKDAEDFRWISLAKLGFNDILKGARMMVMRK